MSQQELMGAPLPCDPRQRVVFKYVKHEATLQPLGSPEVPKEIPGTWYWRNPGEAPFLTCPRCGHSGRLGKHSVNARGEVAPSIMCAMMSCGDGVSRCDAHYYARLEGFGYYEEAK